VVDPWKGDIVDFTKAFALPGTPVSGTLWITADDGYEVSLNGNFVGNHGLLSGWRTSDLKYIYVPGHGIWKSVEKYDIGGKLTQGTNTLFIQTANRYMGCDNPVVRNSIVSADETLELTDTVVAPAGGVIAGCGSTCAEPKGTADTNAGALKYEAYICTESSTSADAWVPGTLLDANNRPFRYFTYFIENVDLGFSPAQPKGVLPDGASQSITVTAYDRLGERIPGLALTFSTSFGAFPGGSRVITGTTDVNGNIPLVVRSDTGGQAILTGWTDTNGNGVMDKNEWSSDVVVLWLVPSHIGLTPGEASVQLPDTTSKEFTANVADQYGMVMAGAPVTFSTDFGSLNGDGQVVNVITNDKGFATVTIASTMAGTATLTAKAGSASAISTMTWVPEVRIAAVSLGPEGAAVQLPATSQLLTATVIDQHGLPMEGTQVAFVTGFGSFDGSALVTTGPDGTASIAISSTDAGMATVAAMAGQSTDAVTVEWIPEPPPVLLLSAPQPTPDPTIEATPDPTPDPVTEPAVDPTPDPTPDPAAQPAVDPTPDPTPDPGSP